MEKPEDRIKAWQEKAAEVLLIRTDRQADEEDYYVAGCEHVWNTHVVPFGLKNANLEDWNRELIEKLKVSESENKALREEIERLKADNP